LGSRGSAVTVATKAQKVSIVVEGKDELLASLKEAGERIRTISHARPNAIEADRAAEYAPHETGDLANSIRPLEFDEPGIYSNSAYAHVIEFGDSDHNIEPDPFMVPGIVDSAEAWLPVYVEEINIILEDVKGA